MSLVIAAISKDNDIIVCADSRIVDNNDVVVTENENKIYQVNNKCAIGYAGNKNAFDCLKIYLEIKLTFLDDKNIDAIYNEILIYMDRNKSDLHLIITGFDKENNPKLYVVVSNYSTIRKYDLSNLKYMGIGDYDFDLEINIYNDINTITHDIQQIIHNRAKVNNTINNIINQVILKQ